jgi:hypothetical protein
MRPVGHSAEGADATLSACLAALLELDAVEVRSPHAWQEWLAARNLRLVRAAELPAAGFWIGEVGEGRFVVMFGAPSDVVWDPAGASGPGVAARAGWVLAALDPALRGWVREVAPAGTVAGLFVAEAAEAPCRSVARVDAVAGRGLRGDRYFDGAGTFSAGTLSGRNLTLIEAEALEALATEHGVLLEPSEARRNVLTRGIALNDLVGREFLVGEVRCAGRRWCEPCAHLQRLTRDGTLRGLIHRGGLRADVLTDGEIALGDPIEAL